MPDSAVLITLISTVGAIISTWLVAKYKNKIVKKNDKPTDRMEIVFDGYEKLIKQQQIDIEQKGTTITHLTNIVDRLESDLNQTRKLLEIASNDLIQAKEQNKLLTIQLAAMKEEYTHPTAPIK